MTLVRKMQQYFAVIVFMLSMNSAHAVIEIVITRGIDGALPVAVVPFGWSDPRQAPPQDVAGIISADLTRSGRFAPIKEKDLIALPHDASQVKFQNWRILGTEFLVVGKVGQAVANRYSVQFQLFDVFKGEQLAGYSFQVPANRLRRIAHHISDLIYEKLTGQKGAFNTRIAYITTGQQGKKPRYKLKVSDSDGFNEISILDSPSPLMSPAWAQDGNRLAYVTFEGGRSRIFIQYVNTGKRVEVTSYRGINGAPAWSPDGRRLALTLSKDGNAEIYVLTIASRQLRRITRNGGIDTEPAWSPDGRSLVFTSNRGGKPQIYQVTIGPAGAAGRPKRLTFDGEYNARASISPDGKLMTFVYGNKGIYRIAVQELATGNLTVLTDSRLDESPSFAPNGSMVIYATSLKNRGILAAVSVDGRVQQKLAVQQGDVREPAWSPYNR
ncbi:MAG: Tol-Pal system beta propeller repeat protein TolB [Gammaproteobacteria bacterium]|nr:MAG: Tol-Pal system beta propeller repeat protein TolB [Gammaproteobacteria bacterium]